MKKILIIMIACCLMLMCAACTNNSANDIPPPAQSGSEMEQPEEKPEENPNDTEQPSETTTSLVFKKEGSAYTVTGFTGEEREVTIPAEYDGLPVTKIQGNYGTGAFARKDILSVTISDSITEIGQNSFNNCSQLESVKISKNSKLIKIGNNAFSGNSALKNIFIPKGTVEIGDSVFNNCGALESITVAEENTVYRSENGHLIERATQTLIRGSNNGKIPDGVKIIAQAAFRRASRIERLSIPKSVESIANYFIADSTIAIIDYKGTEEEWNAITKSKMWNYGKENVQISLAQNTPIEDEKEITAMYLYINGNKLEVTLAENKAVTALIDILKQGDITYTAEDYGGFEKVGSLGHSLPTENSQITTEAGDVILYSGNQIVLFYGSNSWSYTRLGKINGYSVSELRNLLGAGNGSIQVRISLK